MRSGEIEQLLDDALTEARLVVDDPQLVAAWARLGAQELRVADDHRQRIVELVRDTGRDLADRGELLRSHECCLFTREARRHAVERRRELRELVVARKLDPRVEVTRADAASSDAEGIHAAHDRAREPQAHSHRERDR